MLKKLVLLVGAIGMVGTCFAAEGQDLNVGLCARVMGLNRYLSPDLIEDIGLTADFDGMPVISRNQPGHMQMTCAQGGVWAATVRLEWDGMWLKGRATSRVDEAQCLYMPLSSVENAGDLPWLPCALWAKAAAENGEHDD